ncbi:DUF4890 domain-containing protein [Phocaeicola plebeius]|uniref:DUF4890 domain-containing protein n=1 Tax=Phocaeicola plebeius TaxID=310297 RepID=UPI003FF034CB
MKKIVWMACGMVLMCAPLSASANVRYDDPQEKMQKKEVPNPEKAAQRRTDEMDKALNLTEKQYKKIYKLFLKEEKEKVEAMMQRHPGGMNGQPPMGGRHPMGGGRPPMGGGMPPQGGGFPGMGGFPEGMSPEERMKEHAEKMQKEQEKREKKIRKILTEEQYATWQTVKPQVLPPMPEGERPGTGPRGLEEEEAPLLDTAAE